MSGELPSLLLIDDEARILRSLSMLFRGRYRVLATADPQTALATVRSERVHVVVSDQKMPLMRGADLLREVRTASPNTMRILLTGYSELDAVIASVNEGEIFRYVNKPWDAAELRATVAQAAAVAETLFAVPASPFAKAIELPMAMPADGLRAPEGLRQEPAILVVDDDEEVFEAVRAAAGPAQAVHWARSLDQAFELLAQHPIGVIVSELSVGPDSMSVALKLLKAQHPDVVTIILTPFQDTGVLINLINQGQIFRLLPKPVRRGPLGMNLASALRHHRALKLSPALRERHAVQPLRDVEAASVASRVIGFLDRLRGRAQNA